MYNRPKKDLHRVIKWFWEVVDEMTTEERVRLLQFVTGSGRLPAHGFKALQSNDGIFRKFNVQSISKQVNFLYFVIIPTPENAISLGVVLSPCSYLF